MVYADTIAIFFLNTLVKTCCGAQRHLPLLAPAYNTTQIVMQRTTITFVLTCRRKPQLSENKPMHGEIPTGI